MKTRSKIFLAVLLLIALIPIHVYMSDGGSDGWHAILWQYTNCHELAYSEDGQLGFIIGPRMSILEFISVYDGTYFEPIAA